jgi:hypothetical protein
MELGDALRNLADLVDELEESSTDVIEATPGEVNDEWLVADLRVRIPADGGPDRRVERGSSPDVIEQSETDGSGDPESNARRTSVIDVGAATKQGAANSTSESGDGATAGVGGRPDSADHDASVATDTDTDDATGPVVEDEEADPEPAGDESVECTVEGCEASFDSEHGMRIHRSKAHGPGSADRDPETLSAVYEQHDSFAEMREALDADVSAQTVRRWMIEADVHTPAGRPSAAGGSDGSSDAGTGSRAEERAGDGVALDGSETAAASGTAGADGVDDSPDEAPERRGDAGGDGRGATTNAEQPGDDAGTAAADADRPGNRDSAAATTGSDRPLDRDDGGSATDAERSDDDATGAGAERQPTDRDDEDGGEVTPDSDGPGSTEPAAGIDERLPAAVTATELQEAVQAASTLYEVQKRLDLDREATRELLAELDLLELVHGRVADRHRREELKDEIDYRLRANAAAADSRSD